jgi:2-aminoethylphosphonate dioxygenase
MPEFDSDEYKAKGYLRVRGLFGEADVQAWQDEADRLLDLGEVIHEFNWRTVFRKERGHWWLEKFDPVTDVSPVFDGLAQDERVLDVAHRALATNKDIGLVKDKLIFKHAGQNGYPVHQDYSWWHAYGADDICTIVVAIDEATEDNGAIEFVAGCHHRPLLSDGYRALSEQELAVLDGHESEVVELAPGDLLVFHSLTPHWSGPNLSIGTRRLFYPTYVAGAKEGAHAQHAERQRRHLAEQMQPELRDRMTLL